MFLRLIDALTELIIRFIPSPDARLKRMDLYEEKIRQKSINKAEKLSIRYERIKRRNEKIKKRIEKRKRKKMR